MIQNPICRNRQDRMCCPEGKPSAAATVMPAACAAQACGTVEGAPEYFFKSAYEHEKQAEVSKNHGEIFWRLLVCGELLLRTRRFLPKSS